MDVFAVGYHAHLLGREMYAELTTADGKSIDFGSQRIWHFDDQKARNVLLNNWTLRTGDHLQTTCIFDSTARTENTVIGIETTDEMCFATARGWPGTTAGTCEGPVWMGELADDEHFMGLAQRHPVANATEVWDGSMLGNGGALIRSSTPIETDLAECEDMAPLAGFCPVLVTMAADKPNGSCATLLGDLADQVGRMLPGKTIRGVCCTAACEQMCPREVNCPAAPTTTLPATTAVPATPTTTPAGAGKVTGAASVETGTTLKADSSATANQNRIYDPESSDAIASTPLAGLPIVALLCLIGHLP
jgi:hypothetical protein